ncbi:sulfate/molybdate ABC transporter ATP-binding protein [Streptomyces sp. AC495_CC817]|uniref:sulfate/molybdate ABC transporter ATP-binding protein n=1 Tax=Streptomyces sp. AC495_CC817 TaxID=2823900 RepID=UPI001C273832|nr:ABC transporter ATP-binding protein [Streptomyces sp. AC495_CC817]
MSLDVDVVARAGSFRVDAAFSVAPGEVLAILGPNGSGKSTLLAAIAGHLRATTGALSLGGTGIPAPVPPEQRRIGLLGQRAMLFPHLSARENVAFGPRAQGLSARAARERADRWLAEVGMGDLARRRPAQLSGGQQQRVALARSLAAEPGALLLDEPFASLDAETGTSARRLIARLRDRLGIPMIVVTHDALDAVMLAARTVVIDGGRIVQQGATAEVLGHPRSRFAAAIAGVNLVTGAGVAEGALRADAGMLLHGRGDRLREGESGSAVFAPAAVRIAADAPLTRAPSANSWRGTVSVMEATRGGVRLFTEEHPHLAVECPPGIAASLGIRPGLALALSVSPDDVSLRREPPASL